MITGDLHAHEYSKRAPRVENPGHFFFFTERQFAASNILNVLIVHFTRKKPYEIRTK